MVRRSHTTLPWGSTQLNGSTKSRKERVRPKVGKDRVCIFVVWQDEMKMRCCLSTPGSFEYILHVAHSTSSTPVSLCTHRPTLTTYLEAVIELVWRCTWRPRLSELRDALWGCDRASLEMHLEAEMEWTQRCTYRPWSSEFGHALGGRHRVNSEMHFEAVIEWVCRCTSRPIPSELRDAVGGRDRSSLEVHWEGVIEWVWRCTCRLWSSKIGGVLGGSQFVGRRDSRWGSIHWLPCNCRNVQSWVQHPPSDEKLAASGRPSILGWWCTWCMLYWVLTHDFGMETEKGMN